MRLARDDTAVHLSLVPHALDHPSSDALIDPTVTSTEEAPTAGAPRVSRDEKRHVEVGTQGGLDESSSAAVRGTKRRLPDPGELPRSPH